MVIRSVKTTSLLGAIAILALFSGININGRWAWPFELAFVETPRIWTLFISGSLPKHSSILALSLHTLTTILLLSFPFVYNRIKGFSTWLMVVGLLFLLAQFELASIFAIIFLPLGIIWILTLIHVQRLQKTE